MAKKTSSKINLYTTFIFFFIFLIKSVSASYILDYDINSSNYIVKLDINENTTISTLEIPIEAKYSHLENSFFNNQTLYKIINTTDTKELRYFDFYNDSFNNYMIEIFLNPLKNSKLTLKTYESDTPNVETINIEKKEIIPLYLYIFSKNDYTKVSEPINGTINLTSGIPYLLNLYKRSTTIDELTDISKKVQINDDEILNPYNYIQNGTQYYINDSLEIYKKYTKQLDNRFFIGKIEDFNCSRTMHYKVNIDLQEFEFNINFNKPQINDIYLMVDVFIDEPDNNNFERIYKMVDLFIEC